MGLYGFRITVYAVYKRIVGNLPRENGGNK